MEKLISFLVAMGFWGFIIVKAWGTAFAAWSWWWVLLSTIPWLWMGLTRAGLM